MLTSSQKRYLRGLAHGRRPVVTVGDRGVTDTLIEELDSSLEHHELLKVRIHGADREQRSLQIEQLCARSQAQLVQTIGHVAVLYRPATEPKLNLPGG